MDKWELSVWGGFFNVLRELELWGWGYGDIVIVNCRKEWKEEY